MKVICKNQFALLCFRNCLEWFVYAGALNLPRREKKSRKTASRNVLTNSRSPLHFTQGRNHSCYYLRSFPRTVVEICFQTIQHARNGQCKWYLYSSSIVAREKNKCWINSIVYLGCHRANVTNYIWKKHVMRNMRPDQNKVILPITWKPLALPAISYSSKLKNILCLIFFSAFLPPFFSLRFASFFTMTH